MFVLPDEESNASYKMFFLSDSGRQETLYTYKLKVDCFDSHSAPLDLKQTRFYCNVNRLQTLNRLAQLMEI